MFQNLEEMILTYKIPKDLADFQMLNKDLILCDGDPNYSMESPKKKRL